MKIRTTSGPFGLKQTVHLSRREAILIIRELAAQLELGPGSIVHFDLTKGESLAFAVGKARK